MNLVTGVILVIFVNWKNCDFGEPGHSEDFGDYGEHRKSDFAASGVPRDFGDHDYSDEFGGIVNMAKLVIRMILVNMVILLIKMNLVIWVSVVILVNMVILVIWLTSEIGCCRGIWPVV